MLVKLVLAPVPLRIDTLEEGVNPPLGIRHFTASLEDVPVLGHHLDGVPMHAVTIGALPRLVLGFDHELGDEGRETDIALQIPRPSGGRLAFIIPIGRLCWLPETRDWSGLQYVQMALCDGPLYVLIIAAKGLDTSGMAEQGRKLVGAEDVDVTMNLPKGAAGLIAGVCRRRRGAVGQPAAGPTHRADYGEGRVHLPRIGGEHYPGHLSGNVSLDYHPCCELVVGDGPGGVPVKHGVREQGTVALAHRIVHFLRGDKPWKRREGSRHAPVPAVLAQGRGANHHRAPGKQALQLLDALPDGIGQLGLEGVATDEIADLLRIGGEVAGVVWEVVGAQEGFEAGRRQRKPIRNVEPSLR